MKKSFNLNGVKPIQKRVHVTKNDPVETLSLENETMDGVIDFNSIKKGSKRVIKEQHESGNCSKRAKLEPNIPEV